MKTLFLALFLLLAVSAGAQTVINNQIVIGTVDSLHSKILNEKRKLWIYLPPGAKDTTFGKQHYPVAYLIDGPTNFSYFTTVLQSLSNSGKCPQMIVVGIDNTDRVRDLTPTHSMLMDDGKTADFLKNSGGGENFAAFIKDELIPHIDSIYPTNKYRLLMGHSLGGLTALDIFLNHTSMFNSYVLIDPSIWWDHRILLSQAKEFLKTRNYKNITMYLAIANTFSPLKDTLQARKDTTGDTEHYRSIIGFNDAAESNKGNGLIYKSAYYKNDDHGAVPLIAQYDALHFIFDYYPFSVQEKVKMKTMPDSKIEVTVKHYKIMSERLGYNILPPDFDMVNIGWYHLMKGNTAKAYEAFSTNLANYPQSAMANNAMGDYYSYLKDKTKAADYYKRSLHIKEDNEVRKKLNALLNK